jgi:dsRNA-specific ribonuclease
VQVLSAAEGPSKKEAQQRAAEIALAHWKAATPRAEAAP